jgi:phage FluMu protein Com
VSPICNAISISFCAGVDGEGYAAEQVLRRPGAAVDRSLDARPDRSASFVSVTELPAAEGQTIVCPHCKKTFVGELLAGGSRHEGFKCPHCRLFVPIERANGGAPTQP